eukprot:Gregarina_sp_Poly_1__1935@NODE_1506_length_3978_cov_75_398619_g998_i0_p3_GENE_NODE_1506_length_3978_cov_75_398619_g998_i0NODE_1506_length_3978_cov_75_398619_g998_i0_p3_ORF_typecomplete_len122_score4_16BPL_LplA_LipB/PF03099_19/0_12_NODE_1506_length_3978_cov_75_398619_g998_i09681333
MKIEDFSDLMMLDTTKRTGHQRERKGRAAFHSNLGCSTAALLDLSANRMLHCMEVAGLSSASRKTALSKVLSWHESRNSVTSSQAAPGTIIVLNFGGSTSCVIRSCLRPVSLCQPQIRCSH